MTFDISIYRPFDIVRENYSVVIFAQSTGPLFTPTDWPTGHCPNARMASPPLLLVERSYVVHHVRVFLVVPSRGLGDVYKRQGNTMGSDGRSCCERER